MRSDVLSGCGGSPDAVPTGEATEWWSVVPGRRDPRDEDQRELAEEVRRHAGTDAAHVYGGLMATLTAWAELRGVPYEGVPVGTIKRFANSTHCLTLRRDYQQAWAAAWAHLQPFVKNGTLPGIVTNARVQS